MQSWELVGIALGLATDAFAVSIAKGLSVPRATIRQAVAVGLWFGGFQAGMPLLGYALGSQFGRFITTFDHWIAFALLVTIGSRMIHASRSDDEEVDDSFSVSAMFPLAVATSIDALAVGVSFAFLDVEIGQAAAMIGVITLVLSVLGLTLGSRLGARNKRRAELAGGVILITIGTTVLVDHLNVLG